MATITIMLLPREWNAKQFRNRLVKARKGAGLTQSELGELIGESQAYVSNWENGHANATSLAVLARFVEALGVTSDYLIGITDSPKSRRGDTLPADVTVLIETYAALSDVGKEEVHEELQRIATTDEERRDDDAQRETYAKVFDGLLTEDESAELRDAILAARAGDLATADALARRLRKRLGLDPKN